MTRPKTWKEKSFDELAGELKKAGVRVPKSGTLKALNKQRVLTKHYAQVAEPVTVRNYFDAAEQAVDVIVKNVIGFSIRELYLADLLSDSPAKSFLKNAEALIPKGKHLDALIEIRKAIFVEFELPYSVGGWSDVDEKVEPLGIFAVLTRGGHLAPYWTRSKDWIEKNVSEPTQYVQVDSERWRVEAMELGIHTAELENLRSLTPRVFRADDSSPWCVSYELELEANDATEANAKYCLDRAIAIVLKKQEHSRAARRRNRGKTYEAPSLYVGESVYKKASTASDVVHVVSTEFMYQFETVVTGFDPNETFYRIFGYSNSKTAEGRAKELIHGFLRKLPERDS